MKATVKRRVDPRIRQIAEKYFPKSYWDSGELESDYDYKRFLKASKEVVALCANIAAQPYGDDVCLIGEHSPLITAARIRNAIVRLVGGKEWRVREG